MKCACVLSCFKSFKKSFSLLKLFPFFLFFFFFFQTSLSIFKSGLCFDPHLDFYILLHHFKFIQRNSNTTDVFELGENICVDHHLINHSRFVLFPLIALLSKAWLCVFCHKNVSKNSSKPLLVIVFEYIWEQKYFVVLMWILIVLYISSKMMTMSIVCVCLFIVHCLQQMVSNWCRKQGNKYMDWTYCYVCQPYWGVVQGLCCN